MEDLGVGIAPDTAHVGDAVRTVLGEASFRAAAARAAERIAAAEPDRTAAEAVERIARTRVQS